MGKKQTVTIKSNEENPEPIELVAASIIKISEAFEKISNSGLRQRTIVLLLHDAIGPTKIGKKDIELVLEYAPRLKDIYVTPKAKK